ncbi:EKC/KEOPS complex subunit Tprkb isoform X3 [Rhodamnia argentea]|uniref:EKC/KEOPS complex subunit Tprkb isoform X3 n=1 Tax=Rhodamnia argentea TaxID=178133 RepID=A0A8B8NL60_9MYRT|nr:EKC/KEOPS complex subunit Tprkb isoform X3 [Rhodamnia argentea]
MKAFGISNGDTLSVALFTDVTNSKELLDSMQAGTLEPEIPDIFPVLAAAHKTLLSNSRGSLTTRTLHSELVYNYSGSKHITESLKRCGISDSSTYVLAARFNASPDEMKAIAALTGGREIELEELEGKANLAQIQKVRNTTRYLARNWEYRHSQTPSHAASPQGTPYESKRDLPLAYSHSGCCFCALLLRY